MIEPKKVFIDTSAWIANLLKKEQDHDAVFHYLKKEIPKGTKFYTSDYVLDETYTKLLTGQGIFSARSFRVYIIQALDKNLLTLLWINQDMFAGAYQLFEKYSEHKLSFTDATIAVYVQEFKLDEILTLDGGFKKIGLSVRPEIDK